MSEDENYRQIVLKLDSGCPVIALAGNPNTGKSTLFNALTGLRQHTGNWPGKTVLMAQGSYIYQGQKYLLVDLPGTYSLLANSADEEVARDFICFLQPDVTVVVVGATCLERNLNLALQVMEVTGQVIVCVNMMDEARRKNIKIDIDYLQSILRVPVIGAAIRQKEGLGELRQVIKLVAEKEIAPQPYQVRYSEKLELAIAQIQPLVAELIGNQFNTRWLALRLLENPQQWLDFIQKH